MLFYIFTVSSLIKFLFHINEFSAQKMGGKAMMNETASTHKGKELPGRVFL